MLCRCRMLSRFREHWILRLALRTAETHPQHDPVGDRAEHAGALCKLHDGFIRVHNTQLRPFCLVRFELLVPFCSSVIQVPSEGSPILNMHFCQEGASLTSVTDLV